MSGLSARSVLSHVAAFAGDVIETESSEEIGHLLFRPAGHDGPVVSVVAELVFLSFTRELNIVPPNPVAGMNFANRDFDVEVIACHDISSCGSNPAKPVRGTIPPPDKSLLDKRFTFVKPFFLNFSKVHEAIIFSLFPITWHYFRLRRQWQTTRPRRGLCHALAHNARDVLRVLIFRDNNNLVVHMERDF